MHRQSVLLVLLVILSSLAPLTTTTATSGKTNDLLIVSGGQNERRIKAESLLQLDTGEYLVFGDFSIVSRGKSAVPLEVTIWSRGAGEFAFIELTPLLSVFDDPKSASDLRNALLTTDKGAAKVVKDSSDRERLESLLSKAAAGTSEKLRLQRTTALERMRSSNLSSFEQLFAQYEKQKEFATGAWMTPKPSQLGELIGVTPDPGANADDGAAWSKFIRLARERQLVSPLLHTWISSSTEPRVIGYVLMPPGKETMKLGGEIFLATNESEPERIPVALEIHTAEPFLQKVYAVIPTTLVGLVATFGGAFIGYKFFQFQQHDLRRIEEEKKFADRKVELSKSIRSLFKNDYSGLRNSQDSELDRAKQIRDALIDGDIYSILLWKEVERINNICDPNYAVPGSRLEALDKVLEDNFKEFMV
ncbi:MAG TPA: hypothetical protein VJS64_15375 [Pyrinomonadaceae bacterium]|nr:hypothetical protein [Pyrinomonadaceae bacterium]